MCTPRALDLPLWTLTLVVSACGGTSPTPSPTEQISPTPAPTGEPSPSPTSAPSPEPTAAPPATPGAPSCARTRGDEGGVRISMDGGASLLPGDRPLPSSAVYTWDVEVSPADPNLVLELFDDTLFRSGDAGCTFAPWHTTRVLFDAIRWAPSDPGVIVLTSVYQAEVEYTLDGGERWQREELPGPVYDLRIDPSRPGRWLFAGREGCLWIREEPGARWECRQAAIDGAPVTTPTVGAGAPSDVGRWLVADYDGLYLTRDEGQSWERANAGLHTALNGEEVLSWVTASVSWSSSDPDVVYAALNTVALSTSRRGLWRSSDGGASWLEQVGEGDTVGGVVVQLTGGSEVFVDPADPDHALFAFGTFYDGYGTDLFRSHDGLSSLEVSHFEGFDEIKDIAFSPAVGEVLWVGISTEVPSSRAVLVR